MSENAKKGNITSVVDLTIFDVGIGSAELLNEEGEQITIQWISFTPCYKGTVLDESIYTLPTTYQISEIAELANRRFMTVEETEVLRNMYLSDEKNSVRDKKNTKHHIDIDDVDLIRDLMSFLSSSLKNMIGDTAVVSVIDTDLVRNRSDIEEIEPLIGQVIDIYDGDVKSSVELYPAKKNSRFVIVVHMNGFEDKEFFFETETRITIVEIHEYIKDCTVTTTLDKVGMRRE